MKVALIDDAPDVVEVVSLALEMRWPDVEIVSAGEGRRALSLVRTGSPDVVIMDIGLPDMSGFQLISEIRRFSDVPIIVLSVHGGETDVVRALELGADDYIPKPFSHIELLARMQAVLRRVQALPPVNGDHYFQANGLTVDFSTRDVRVGGRPVKLSPLEYNLLYHLIRNEGQTLTHCALLQKVWGPQYAEDIAYTKVYVQRLRNKLGNTPHIRQMIVNDRGIGYRFVAPG